MTLRSKTLIIVGVAIVGLIGVLYVASRVIALASFAELEERAASQNVEQVLSSVSEELSILDTTVYDWASWDDTYSFMDNENPEYVRSNLLDDTFVALRLNVLLLVDPSGWITFGKAFDLQSEQQSALPEGLMEHLSPEGLLLSPEDTRGKVAGVLLLDEGAMLLSSRPILTSEDQGPMRGTLIMGRYLDSGEVDRLAETAHLSVAVRPFDDPRASAEFQAVRAGLSKGVSTLVRPLSEESIGGYALLKDIYGDHSLVLGVEMPRPIYEQGQATMHYFMWVVTVIGLALGAITLLLLDRQILSRLGRLSKGASGIGASSDVVGQVPLTGDDELSTVGGGISGMLERLEKAQADRRESEERFRRMADNIQDGIVIIEQGRVAYVNDRACEIFGYPRDELVKLGPARVAAPDEKERVRLMMEQAHERGGELEDLEFWIVRKDGTRRCIHSRYSQSGADDGPLVQYVIATDVTERKQAEAELKSHSERLEQMVEERTRELREAQEELIRRGKLAVLGQLAGGVGHELRNPLGVISNAVYFLQMTLAEADETTREYLDIIASQVQTASKIVSDLLDLSRIRSAEKEETTVSELVFEALERQPAPDGVEARAELAGDVPPVFVDARQIVQVLVNVFSNAYDSMPEGGQVTVDANADGDFVYLSVTDSGCGMSEETMRKLFEPLFTTKAGGIGLGLAVSKSLVEANGGSIEVMTEEGRGSTFTLVLPTRGRQP